MTRIENNLILIKIILIHKYDKLSKLGMCNKPITNKKHKKIIKQTVKIQATLDIRGNLNHN